MFRAGIALGAAFATFRSGEVRLAPCAAGTEGGSVVPTILQFRTKSATRVLSCWMWDPSACMSAHLARSRSSSWASISIRAFGELGCSGAEREFSALLISSSSCTLTPQAGAMVPPLFEIGARSIFWTNSVFGRYERTVISWIIVQ